MGDARTVSTRDLVTGDELLFAYESVRAPKLPCLNPEESKRIEKLKSEIMDGVRRIRRRLGK